MSEWQPIETAPKDGSVFLAAIEVHNPDAGTVGWDYALMYFDEGRFEFYDGADTGWWWDDYTKWQPIEPPK